MTSPLQNVQVFPFQVQTPTNSDPALASSFYADRATAYFANVCRTNWLSALALGPGNAPPYSPVPTPTFNVGNGTFYGQGSGVQRIQQISGGSPSTLPGTLGALGDIINCGLFGVYGLVPYTGAGADGINVFNLLTATVQGWTASTLYAQGEMLYTSGQLYFCSTPGQSAASGTGPTGTGNVTDGGIIWTSVANAPQWVWMGFGRTVNVSAGSGDAGFLPRLNASGQLDSSFINYAVLQLGTNVSYASTGTPTTPWTNSPVAPGTVAGSALLTSAGGWQDSGWSGPAVTTTASNQRIRFKVTANLFSDQDQAYALFAECRITPPGGAATEIVETIAQYSALTTAGSTAPRQYVAQFELSVSSSVSTATAGAYALSIWLGGAPAGDVTLSLCGPINVEWEVYSN